MVIPLSYPSAILRLVVSPFISFIALCARRDRPAAPIIDSSVDLYHKATRDLSRLLVVGKELFNLIYNITASVIKMPAVILGMAAGRVSSLFGVRASHAIYKIFSEIHVATRQVIEFFNPGRALKSVTFAHPNDTLKRVKNTYEMLLDAMPKHLSSQLRPPTPPPIHRQGSPASKQGASGMIEIPVSESDTEYRTSASKSLI